MLDAGAHGRDRDGDRQPGFEGDARPDAETPLEGGGEGVLDADVVADEGRGERRLAEQDAATAGPQLNGITFGFLAPGVFTLVLIFSVLTWFYPARIIRGQVLSLREKEFVEAARMTGASDWRIIRSHLAPHLVGPVIVYSTLIVATNIIFEAGLSFLGLGIQEPTSSWGNILSRAPQYYLTQPNLMIWPGLMILLATLAFNLLGDGLRDAFDPRKTSS